MSAALDSFGLGVGAQRSRRVGGVGHEADGAQRAFLARKVIRSRFAAHAPAGVAR